MIVNQLRTTSRRDVIKNNLDDTTTPGINHGSASGVVILDSVTSQWTRQNKLIEDGASNYGTINYAMEADGDAICVSTQLPRLRQIETVTCRELNIDKYQNIT